MTEVQSKTVMIIDDTLQNLKLLENMLVHQNFRVFAFTSGEAAIKAAEKNIPDIILLDINMPVMNGYEVCRIMKRKEKLADVPVIFLSALTDTEDKVEAFRAGGVDYITKPFNFEEVESRVNTHIRIKELQEELKYKNEELEKIVDIRTKELQEAYKKLKVIEKMKSEFLQIMSHEIRTPFNGLIGSIEMMIAVCPGNCESGGEIAESRQMYYEARESVFRLMEDATLMGEVENLESNISTTSININWLLADVCREIESNFIVKYEIQEMKIESNYEFLMYALKMAFKVVECFTSGMFDRVCIVKKSEDFINVEFFLDKLELSEEECKKIFDITCMTRGETAIAKLGMSPVVANKVFEILGGAMGIEKKTEKEGYLKVILKSYKT